MHERLAGRGIGLTVPAKIRLRNLDTEPGHLLDDFLADIQAIGQLAAEDAQVAILVVRIDGVLARQIEKVAVVATIGLTARGRTPQRVAMISPRRAGSEARAAC